MDDNAERRRDLQVMLAFLGVDALCIPCNGWQQAADMQGENVTFLAVMLGDSTLSLGQCVGELHRWDPAVPVILLGQREQDAVLEPELCQVIVAVLPEPSSYHMLLDILYRCRVHREQHVLQRGLDVRHQPLLFQSLVGFSGGIVQVREMMGQVAGKDVPVLIVGETGTGKEMVARSLHGNSSRRNKPFVPVHCGAILPELLENELFGYEKGAFAGAFASHAGRFELADGGTLFLDDIGDLPLPTQVKILRVLQEHSYERSGGARTMKTDVRIVAATSHDLEALVAQGRFREDLYYRLNMFPIEIPPLRERTEDIPLLINALVARLEREGRGCVRFNSAAVATLCRHEWQGNVRTLANLVERMAIMNPYGVVGVRELPKKFRCADEQEQEAGSQDAPSLHRIPLPAEGGDDMVAPEHILLPVNGLNLKDYLNSLEMSLIEQALSDCNGVVARAADRLQIRRTTLVEKMRKYGIGRDDEPVWRQSVGAGWGAQAAR